MSALTATQRPNWRFARRERWGKARLISGFVPCYWPNPTGLLFLSRFSNTPISSAVSSPTEHLTEASTESSLNPIFQPNTCAQLLDVEQDPLVLEKSLEKVSGKTWKDSRSPTYTLLGNSQSLQRTNWINQCFLPFFNTVPFNQTSLPDLTPIHSMVVIHWKYEINKLLRFRMICQNLHWLLFLVQ